MHIGVLAQVVIRPARLACLALIIGIVVDVARGQPPAGQRDWAHESSDILPDPSVTFGVLPNGMRYALRPNDLPAAAVSMRLVIDFGSLNESEGQQGLAHFIEHMAFAGSSNVPEGEMVKSLQRMGIALGAGVNATTSLSTTIYKLDAPQVSGQMLEDFLFLFREVASELTFEPTAIERQRSIILAEYYRADDFKRARREQQLDFLIPGSHAASRPVSGDPAVIETVQRDELVALYDAYYRPELATLVIVGDFDLSVAGAAIYSHFADWTGRGRTGETTHPTYRQKPREIGSSLYVHEDGGDWINVYQLADIDKEADTIAAREARLGLFIGLAAANRRLARMANELSPPFRAARLIHSTLLGEVDVAIGSISIEPGAWKLALETFEQEWRRARQYGFSENEVRTELRNLNEMLSSAAAREQTRPTALLIGQLTGSIINDTVFSSPSSDLLAFDDWSARLTPEEITARFRQEMGIVFPLVFASSTIDIPEFEDAIESGWMASSATSVSPPIDLSVAAYDQLDFGAPGEVSSDERIGELDTRTVAFSNNVRLNIKSTPFEEDVVLVSLRVGRGALDLESAPRGLVQLMRAFSAGGLQEYSYDDLRELLSGHSAHPYFGITSTSFGGIYRTTPSDLELQLQIAAEFLTAPGYRPEAEARWRRDFTLSLSQLDANAKAVFANRGSRELMSGDSRFGLLAEDGVANRTFAELETVLTPILERSAIEIAIVGDIEEADVIEAVSRTFGALPVRDWAVDPILSKTPAVFRSPGAVLSLPHAGDVDEALVSVVWPVNIDPETDSQGVRVLSVLTEIMRLKLIELVRDDMGLSYSPSTSSTISTVYPGLGYVLASVEVAPRDVETVSEVIESISADLRSGKISADEFERARTPALAQLSPHASSNQYWLALISSAQSRPERMYRQMLPTIELGLRAVTREDLAVRARHWLAVDNAREVWILPEGRGTEEREN